MAARIASSRRKKRSEQPQIVSDQEETEARIKTEFVSGPAGYHSEYRQVGKGDPVDDCLEQPRELIRWAYKANRDEVSKVFTFGDKYVVAKLTNIKESGTLPMEEVMEATGLSEPALKSRLHRARLALREALLPYLKGQDIQKS